MEYTRLSLVLTNKCNAACDFCGLSCAPDGQQVMDADLMLRMIRGARALGIKAVEFSGGEPFLCPELLTKGVQAAHEEKLETEIATNGFWGGWDDDQIIKMLKALNPAAVNISTDFSHMQFIPADHIVRAISACAAMELPVVMSVADMEGAYSAGRFVQSLSGRVYSTDMRFYPVFRRGRAMNMPEERFLPASQTEHFGEIYHDMLSVLYNGDVYSGCPGGVFPSGKRVGNVHETPLQEMISRDCVSRDPEGKEVQGGVL